jgi:hypothetical protein
MPVDVSVIERFCATPKAPELNDDRLVVSDDFVAVIDGATSSGPLSGRSGGVIAAEAVADAVLGLAAEATARQFVDEAGALLDRRIGPWPDRLVSRPCASVVVWSRWRNEIWRVGDCHFRLDDREFLGEKYVDRLSYEFRRAVVRSRLALGLTSFDAERLVATLKQPFMPLVEVQHAFANADVDDPLAYGLINGERTPDRFVEIYPVGDAGEIVLCSDGFARPWPTLAEGLDDLARLKREDPLMVNCLTGSRPFPPGADVFDDTTYVRLALRRPV